jgi:hypothetical protein
MEDGSLEAVQEFVRKKEERFLKPLRSKVKRKECVVFDFETKDDETQEKGWTRPFMCGFDDGERFIAFRNEPEVMDKPWRLRHLLRGGLVDKFMRFIVGCGERYQGKTTSIYAHNGGKFDIMFLIGWLLVHKNEFEFEIASVQSRIQRLDFWPIGKGKKNGYWSILDSLALLPMSLKKVGETFTPGDAEKMAMDLDLPEETTGLSVRAGSWFLGRSRAEAHRTLRDQGLRVIGLVREHIGKNVPDRCPHLRPGDELEIASAFETNVLEEPALKRAKPCPECEKEASENNMLPLDGPGVLADGDTILVEGSQLSVGVRLAWSDTETFDVWEAYNALDCKVLRLGLVKFHDLVEQKLHGEVGITAPSTAMKVFRRVYQKEFIHRNAHFKECNGQCKHGYRTVIERGRKKGVSIAGCGRVGCDSQCHGCAHDWVRQGYYGGRTEMFAEWGWDLRYFDVNSSYPASMLKDMPVGRMVVPKSTKMEVLRELARTHVGFVECEVEIPKDCVLPPLPYKVPEGKRVVIKRPSGEEYVVPPGKLIFPTGKLTGVWDWEELKLLDHPLVKGRIVRVIKSVWYEKSPIFAEMVNDLYRYRQKHLTECFDKKGLPTCGKKCCNPLFSEGLSFCAKLMLNSLYGCRPRASARGRDATESSECGRSGRASSWCPRALRGPTTAGPSTASTRPVACGRSNVSRTRATSSRRSARTSRPCPASSSSWEWPTS